MSSSIQVLINLRSRIKNFCNDPSSFRWSTLSNFLRNDFKQIAGVIDLNNIRSKNFDEFKNTLSDNPRMIHIYFTNLLDEVEEKISTYLKLNSHILKLASFLYYVSKIYNVHSKCQLELLNHYY